MMKLPKFRLSIHIFESQTEQQLLRTSKLPKFGPTIHIFVSPTEQLLHNFEDDEILGHGEVPDLACSFLFSLPEYIQIHYIYYQIQLQTMVNFLVLFLPKMGEITTDKCAVLLMMELKRKMVDFSSFFSEDFTINKNGILNPNLQKNRLVNEIFERKKKKKNQYQFQSNTGILKLGNISQKCILYKINFQCSSLFKRPRCWKLSWSWNALSSGSLFRLRMATVLVFLLQNFWSLYKRFYIRR